MRTPPNERRNFVHKKLLGVAASLVPGGSTALAIGRSLVGGGGASTALAPVLSNLGLTDARRREITRAMNAASARGDSREAAAFLRELGPQGPLGVGAPSVPPRNPVREAVVQAKPLPDVPRVHVVPRARIPFVQPVQQPHPSFQGGPAMPVHRRIIGAFRDTFGQPVAPLAGTPCLPGTFRGPGGFCVDPSAVLPGGDPLFQMAGATVMGRYGPAYQGNSRLITRTTCLPGDLVGDDGLCYNRKSLTNKERMWPRGRQPLFTGGEMRAIMIASRAARKFERTQKRLQKIGMLKKPAPRARAAAAVPPHQHQITSGG